ncbi:MAG TPA: hypothetical protein VE093_26055 [Polyangiaceae bacterium]|nr:hypothetical protein [Polyangiaceae bacterium]
MDALITLWGTTGIATYNYTFGESCDLGEEKPTQMLDPTKIPPRDADRDVWEQFLNDFDRAEEDGLKAALAVAGGGPPDVNVLDEYAQALEVQRVAIAQKRLHCGWDEPTEDNVQSARHLVQLVREGAPSEALIEPALRAARVQTDPVELREFHVALVCLEDEARRVRHLEAIKEVLDQTVALFERGCNVAGFVPTPVDLANVRRLWEIAATEGAEAQAPRLRLVKELLARLPPGSIVDALELQFALRILYRGREKSRVWTPSDMHPGELVVAFYNGARAAQTIADGGAPNLDALAAGAEALAEIHLRFSRGSADFAWLKPTEDDVQNARHLAELVRQGAPSPALVEPARRAVRVATDSKALARFQRILVCLEDETCRAMHLERLKEELDLGVMLFERGVRVAGFASTPLDLASARRLREIVATDGAEAQAPRLRLVKELQARLPPGSTREPFGPEEFDRILYQPDPTRIPEPL